MHCERTKELPQTVFDLYPSISEASEARNRKNPTVGRLAIHEGLEAMIFFLETSIVRMEMEMNTKHNNTPISLRAIAKAIIDCPECNRLKISELKLALLEMRNGAAGKSYGSITIDTIIPHLRAFYQKQVNGAGSKAIEQHAAFRDVEDKNKTYNT